MGSYSGLSGWVPKTSTYVLIRGRQKKIIHKHRRVGGDVVTKETDWNDGATRQGILAATSSWRRQGMDFPLEPLEGVDSLTPWFWPTNTDFILLASRTVKEYIFGVLSYQVICYSSCGKLYIHVYVELLNFKQAPQVVWIQTKVVWTCKFCLSLIF